MFKRILIANRGEIACRIIATARRLGVETVAVYSDADANALHVAQADQAVHIGAAPATESYLKGDVILAAAKEMGAEAIHPGYGFLSENPEFADACKAAGIVFIGPSADAIRKMGLKDEAKRLMQAAGVPVVPGYHGDNQNPEFLAAEADKIGYPVLIKARAGGGGKGMRLVASPEDFASALQSAQREGQASFGDGHVLIEKYITSPRHIEVQVFGDTQGNVVHLYERDCSMQRRHQKVIEEAPAPQMPDEVREAMTGAAVKAAQEIDYSNAGTIEFIVDGSGPLRPDGFWFMEMNTRLQVEHPVTEAVTGTDLVEWQLRVASGEPLPLSQDQITLSGHAVEARIYAEDPSDGFKPAPGMLAQLHLAPSMRVDTGVQSGDAISPFYDPMIAKTITHASTRKAALHSLATGLQDSIVAGTATNIGFLSRLIADEDFAGERLDTGLIDRKLDALSKPASPSAFDALCAVLTAYQVDLTAPYLAWQHFGTAQISCPMVIGDVSENVVLSPTGDGVVEVTFKEAQTRFSNIDVTDHQISARSSEGHHKATIAQNGPQVFVKSSADCITFTRPDPLDVTAAEAASSDAIAAPMTGTVTMVQAKSGQSVAKGDPLIVLEAMKMEHVVMAPRDGKIASIAAKAGDAVSEGKILIQLEPTE